MEEIPLYLPCGEGEHLYLQVEKSGLTTFDLLRRLSRALSVPEREMGYAGLKDARALTRQTVSLPGVRPEQVEDLDLPGVRILSSSLHRNKLRVGHLAGNRFTVWVRGVDEHALDRARETLHILSQVGVPNRFGPQRYGALGNSHHLGRAVLRGDFAAATREFLGDPSRIREPRWREGAARFAAGDWDGALEVLPGHLRDERKLVGDLARGRSPRQAFLALPPRLLRLFLSAYQSHLFDRLLEMRLDSIDSLWPGDLAWKHDNGACFSVVDPGREQPRADRFEISPSGPLFGFKVTLASGQAGLLEDSLLAKEELTLSSFRLPGKLAMPGERRPLRVPLENPVVEQHGPDLRLSFSLPRGSYATSVLREIIKDDNTAVTAEDD